MPQRIHYRRGSLHTVAKDIRTTNVAIFANGADLEVMKLVEKEMVGSPELKRTYPMYTDDENAALALLNMQSVLPQIDTVIAIGSSKMFNLMSIVLAKT